MRVSFEKFLEAVLWAAACGHLGLAQSQPRPPETILVIDVENAIQYFDDVADASKFATDPKATTAIPASNFRSFIVISDIVAVNGQPAKGVAVFNMRQLQLRTNPTPGLAIADVERSGVGSRTFEILKQDGTPIGTIIAEGFGVGVAPPGAPLLVTQANNAILGGTGAFFGVRGEAGQAAAAQTIAGRSASMSEDPANRRSNGGGGKARHVFHLIPLSRPEIASTANGPAVTHSSDFTIVTPARPAAPGEILTIFATGLGPVQPNVGPGNPFPSDPLASVNSPVEVTVNGTSAEVLAAVGSPGTADGYQVNFRVPPNTAKGAATVQVSAAWIASTPVSIPIQ
jgi:hypothetical protein